MSAKDRLHPGYSAVEMAKSPYARFFRPEMAPLPAHVREAILTGPVAPELTPGLEAAPALVSARDWQTGTALSFCPDGEVRVFDRTEMPNVTPAMWDWWFAWHGSEALRYKLWHPRAHVDVGWKDGRGDLEHYVGRTSHVVEYIGSTRLSGAIRFVAPSSLGIDETALEASGAVAICARIGPADMPLEAGWLLHHIRPVPGGSEMRSYFWLGGRHLASRSGGAFSSGLLRRTAKLFPKATSVPAVELLVHCAQEMNHLAGILPDVYEAFGPGGKK